MFHSIAYFYSYLTLMFNDIAYFILILIITKYENMCWQLFSTLHWPIYNPLIYRLKRKLWQLKNNITFIVKTFQRHLVALLLMLFETPRGVSFEITYCAWNFFSFESYEHVRLSYVFKELYLTLKEKIWFLPAEKGGNAMIHL
jgi:hypothetical protein